MKAFAARSANGEPRPCDLTNSDAKIPPGVRSSKARYAIPEDRILMSRALSAANPTPNSSAEVNLYTSRPDVLETTAAANPPALSHAPENTWPVPDTSAPRRHKSSGLSPVYLAIFFNATGPSSSPSCHAQV